MYDNSMAAALWCVENDEFFYMNGTGYLMYFISLFDIYYYHSYLQ